MLGISQVKMVIQFESKCRHFDTGINKYNSVTIINRELISKGFDWAVLFSLIYDL